MSGWLYQHIPQEGLGAGTENAVTNFKKKKKKKTLIVVFSNHPGPNGLERNPLYSVTSAPAAFAEQQLSICSALHPSTAGKTKSPKGTAQVQDCRGPWPGPVLQSGRGTAVYYNLFGVS